MMAEIAGSWESDGRSAARGGTFPGMKIALTGGRVTGEKN